MGALRRMGLGSSLARQSIVNRWPKIVDRVIAKRAKAERLVDDTLYVVVDSSVWMNELSANKFTLLEKINATLEPGVPRIRDIKFTQSSWNRISRKDSQVPETPEVKSVPWTKRPLKFQRVELTISGTWRSAPCLSGSFERTLSSKPHRPVQWLNRNSFVWLSSESSRGIKCAFSIGTCRLSFPNHSYSYRTAREWQQ